MKLSFKWFTENYYEPDHPRVLKGYPTAGQWLQKPHFLALPPPRVKAPEVVKVSGDVWNQETALRLQREFEAVDDHLGEMAKGLVGKSETFSTAPSEWDDLSSKEQDETYDKWKDNHWDSFYESEVDNWRENDAMDDARYDVANDTVTRDWLEDAITEYMEDNEVEYPYSMHDLVMAIDFDYEREQDVEVTFNDDWLNKPTKADYDPEKQLTFPGVEPRKISDSLTPAMRKELTEVATKAFEAEAENRLDRGTIEPPDYLNDSVSEYMSDYWNDVTDSDKFTFAKDYNIISDEEIEKSLELDKLPDKYDPLNLTDGEDYRRTQILAKQLSIARAIELIRARNIKLTDIQKENLDEAVNNIDDSLWRGWKDSSTSISGMILQVAAAEELGGRLYTGKIGNPNTQKENADYEFPQIGGYEGVKAIVRAKWETSQFLLERANKRIVEVYRSITNEAIHNGPVKEISLFKKLTEAKLERNGCASFTLNRDVANGWNSYSRVVLRIVAPRTAVISLPCYGQNVHHEREVILAGTAWKAWDAWKGTAPDFSKIPVDDHWKSENPEPPKPPDPPKPESKPMIKWSVIPHEQKKIIIKTMLDVMKVPPDEVSKLMSLDLTKYENAVKVQHALSKATVSQSTNKDMYFNGNEYLKSYKDYLTYVLYDEIIDDEIKKKSKIEYLTKVDT